MRRASLSACQSMSDDHPQLIAILGGKNRWQVYLHAKRLEFKRAKPIQCQILRTIGGHKLRISIPFDAFGSKNVTVYYDLFNWVPNSCWLHGTGCFGVFSKCSTCCKLIVNRYAFWWWFTVPLSELVREWNWMATFSMTNRLDNQTTQMCYIFPLKNVYRSCGWHNRAMKGGEK